MFGLIIAAHAGDLRNNVWVYGSQQKTSCQTTGRERCLSLWESQPVSPGISDGFHGGSMGFTMG